MSASYGNFLRDDERLLNRYRFHRPVAMLIASCFFTFSVCVAAATGAGYALEQERTAAADYDVERFRTSKELNDTVLRTLAAAHKPVEVGTNITEALLALLSPGTENIQVKSINIAPYSYSLIGEASDMAKIENFAGQISVAGMTTAVPNIREKDGVYEFTLTITKKPPQDSKKKGRKK